MLYYGAKDLATGFRTVRNNTIRAAQDISEDRYGFKVSPDTRSVEKLLTHIAISYRFQHRVHAIEKRTTLVGVNFPALVAELAAVEAQPRTRAEVIGLLESERDVWSNFVEGLPDEFLAERVGMPEGATPASKTRFEMMLSVKEHEMHHRGQIMLIQRQLGVVPHLTREGQARLAQMLAKN